MYLDATLRTPEDFNAESDVRFYAKFDMVVPQGTMNDGNVLHQWASIPGTNDTNYSLSCGGYLEADGLASDWAEVNNFRGNNTMFYDDPANFEKNMWDTNRDQWVNPYEMTYDDATTCDSTTDASCVADTTTSTRRMLKKGGRKARTQPKMKAKTGHAGFGKRQQRHSHINKQVTRNSRAGRKL